MFTTNLSTISTFHLYHLLDDDDDDTDNNYSICITRCLLRSGFNDRTEGVFVVTLIVHDSEVGSVTVRRVVCSVSVGNAGQFSIILFLRRKVCRYQRSLCVSTHRMHWNISHPVPRLCKGIGWMEGKCFVGWCLSRN